MGKRKAAKQLKKQKTQTAPLKKSGKPVVLKQISEIKKEVMKREQRPISLIVVSLLFAFFGILFLFSTLIFAMVFFIPGAMQLSGMAGYPLAAVIVSGIVAIAALVSAVGLWKMKRYGGIAGAILLAVVTAPFDVWRVIGLAIAALMLVLIIINWKKLK